MHVLSRPEAGFYGTHSVATDPGGDGWSTLNALSGSPAELAAAVRNLVVHREGCADLGFTLPQERRNEAETRYLSDILTVLKGLGEGDGGIGEAREPKARFAGTCRDFALLFAAALRHNGIPARLRCGFMTYGLPDFHGDHWVTEYWRPGKGWTLADPEFGGYDPDFDAMDVPRDRFIVAGDAWRSYREGTADPSNFGIRIPDVLDLTGPAMLRGNVVRDLAALNKVEVLPWDCWGLAEGETEPGDADLALLDRVADLESAGGPFEGLRDAYLDNPALKITSPVTSYTTYGGVRIVEIRGE
ncbi:transglutaminase-like domain-containing protein [Phytomonospora sp. NPDC050363]|uniref:transglutaminase-like domain-containing protein n=1 Tax=Phytomonospora sp. NPDC050363 TaxID=3155642 RepID=UPI0033C56D16